MQAYTEEHNTGTRAASFITLSRAVASFSCLARKHLLFSVIIISIPLQNIKKINRNDVHFPSAILSAAKLVLLIQTLETHVVNRAHKSLLFNLLPYHRFFVQDRKHLQPSLIYQILFFLCRAIALSPLSGAVIATFFSVTVAGEEIMPFLTEVRHFFLL